MEQPYHNFVVPQQLSCRGWGWGVANQAPIAPLHQRNTTHCMIRLIRFAACFIMTIIYIVQYLGLWHRDCTHSCGLLQQNHPDPNLIPWFQLDSPSIKASGIDLNILTNFGQHVFNTELLGNHIFIEIPRFVNNKAVIILLSTVSKAYLLCFNLCSLNNIISILPALIFLFLIKHKKYICIFHHTLTFKSYWNIFPIMIKNIHIVPLPTSSRQPCFPPTFVKYSCPCIRKLTLSVAYINQNCVLIYS